MRTRNNRMTRRTKHDIHPITRLHEQFQRNRQRITRKGGGTMKHLITLAIIVAGVAYCVRNKAVAVTPSQLHKILEQEAESERIRRKIISGRYGI